MISKINYAIEIYARKNNKWTEQLQVCQNRILKILFLKDWFFNTYHLHKDFGILKIHDLNKVRLALIIHRNEFHPETQPSPIKSQMQEYKTSSQRSLRNQNLYFLNADSYAYINKVIDSAAIIWNNLSNHIKVLDKRHKFKDGYVKLLTSQYIN